MGGGSFWVPGWWTQGWVACPQNLCDGGRGRPEPPPREEFRPHGWTGSGHPFGADGRRQVLRPGAAAPLAGGGALSRLRWWRGDPGRLRRDPAAAAALPLQGLRGALRRPHRHGAGRAPPAAAGLGAVPLLHGPEPLDPADRRGAGPRRVGCAGHGGAAAPRPGGQDPGGDAGRRGGDRRGLRRGRAQGPAGGGRQKGRLGRRRRLKAAPGRGTLAKDKPPILGLIQRGGQVVLHMLANVRQTTIQPIVAAAVTEGTLVHTDEYKVYARLPAWGLPAQDRLPRAGRIRPRRGRRRPLRGPRQHHGGVLVAAAFLAAPAPRHLAGLRHCRKAAALSRLLRVRAQRPAPRQSLARRPRRHPGGVTGPSPPRIPKRATLI